PGPASMDRVRPACSLRAATGRAEYRIRRSRNRDRPVGGAARSRPSSARTEAAFATGSGAPGRYGGPRGSAEPDPMPIRSGQDRPLRRRLVAVDGSEQGMVVLADACSFAKAVEATLRVLTLEVDQADQPSASTTARRGRLDSQVGAVLSRRGMAAAAPSVEVRRGAIVQQTLSTVGASGP